jgi:hypothetical protein
MTNPGYATWNGPYINNELVQVPNDYKKDSWQSDYVYTGGVDIISIGSGSNINRRLAGSAVHLLQNTVSGNIFDLDGTPPGDIYMDSVTAQLTIPDGSGNMMVLNSAVDAGGYFSFNSVPIGNHDLELIYFPNNDTLRRFVSVRPNSDVYGEYFLATDDWTSGGGGPGPGTGLEFVFNSDTLTTANCFKLSFWIANNTGSPLTITSLTLSWSAPAAYYKTITWNGFDVRTGDPALGSGDLGTFTSGQTINDGESVKIVTEQFHSNPGGGGSPVDMTGITFTVDFSDGSSITFTADLCI